jgi:hypothetical protein
MCRNSFFVSIESSFNDSASLNLTNLIWLNATFKGEQCFFVFSLKHQCWFQKTWVLKKCTLVKALVLCLDVKCVEWWLRKIAYSCIKYCNNTYVIKMQTSIRVRRFQKKLILVVITTVKERSSGIIHAQSSPCPPIFQTFRYMLSIIIFESIGLRETNTPSPLWD